MKQAQCNDPNFVPNAVTVASIRAEGAGTGARFKFTADARRGLRCAVGRLGTTLPLN